MNETATLETEQEHLSATPQEVFSEEPTTTETEKETTEQQPSAQITPEQITASVREGLRQSQPEAPAKQWTQEELDKAFNVWQPTQELVNQIVAGGEGALKALLVMREGLSKQFGTLLNYQLEIAKNELMGRVSPAISFASEAAAARDRESFFSQNEDLRAHEQLTQTVFNALKAEGYKAATTEEAFKTLADRTRALIPQGNGTGAGQSSGVRTTTPTTKRPAALSSGSQAGGGGPSAPVAPFPGAEIWS